MMNPNPNPNKRKRADNVEEKSGMKKRSYESKTCNLKKKTFELSTLCGVDVAFISFATTDGSLSSTWPPNKNQLLPILQRYQQNTPHNDQRKKYIKSSGSSSDSKPPNKKAAAHQSKKMDQPPQIFGKSGCDFVNPPKPKTTTTSSSSEDDDEVAFLKYCHGTLESKLKDIATDMDEYDEIWKDMGSDSFLNPPNSNSITVDDYVDLVGLENDMDSDFFLNPCIEDDVDPDWQAILNNDPHSSSSQIESDLVNGHPSFLDPDAFSFEESRNRDQFLPGWEEEFLNT